MKNVPAMALSRGERGHLNLVGNRGGNMVIGGGQSSERRPRRM